ncbi:Serine phosphatase RsbU, regulator of sigma subunit [Blastococcus aurantiacus]|uniref:Serine phosphatase RsbU, regulator of sigma subunit n=1 Tax=Blastococcus aurantiacus TaxID=1550231 RepID=A0A1G7JD91_9ACTN|nr:PP2C family protein-serine/threonine phosphatase [Blastococcus aurantiacus]SDF22868.1 Serine phosphatase RsbU, regulator of sigma subunit [Blastococcus aurantiacus]
MSKQLPTPDGEALRSLLRASHLLPADQVGSVIAEKAALLGAREAVVYLADYGQQLLLPVPGNGVPVREPLPVDGSTRGQVFRRVELLREPTADGGTRLWLPLIDGAERLGIIELAFPDDPRDRYEEEVRAFVSIVAELSVTRNLYSDVLRLLRRRRPLTMAAEIQWELLPPLTFGTDQIVITGMLEPAYEIGGDTFDYAVNRETADLLVLDAVGHGLRAALIAAAALGAYRHARRAGGHLPEVAAAMNTIIAENFGESWFATALLARINLPTGRLTWVNAGHPAPIVVRQGALVHPPVCPSSRPLGLQSEPVIECETQLEPGDRVLLYTDGVVEARSPDGQFFGEERLADFVIRAEEAGDPPPETLRRLMRSVMDHQAGRLQDDASIVLVEWRTDRHKVMRL